MQKTMKPSPVPLVGKSTAAKGPGPLPSRKRNRSNRQPIRAALPHTKTVEQPNKNFRPSQRAQSQKGTSGKRAHGPKILVPDDSPIVDAPALPVKDDPCHHSQSDRKRYQKLARRVPRDAAVQDKAVRKAARKPLYKAGLAKARSNANERRARSARAPQPEQWIPNSVTLLQAEPVSSKRVLQWPCLPPVPLSVEQDALTVLMQRGRRERGMAKDLPALRLENIQRCCHHSGHLQLPQALSLRRHHIQKLNRVNIKEVGLGTEGQVRDAAECFEQAVEDCLRKLNVPVWTEAQQKAHFIQQPDLTRQPPTPDFILREQMLLKKTSGHPTDGRIVEERVIHWIEVKMFYGASTIPNDDNRSAVGNLRRTARKYYKTYGPGVIVFMYGCGEKLASMLAGEGVGVVDCCGDMVDLERVYMQQRTWCANRNGTILP
jgi:hypothetical protein